ncbi:hypothetical protein [Chryseobacterium sp.]|uniref:hypothetical protein n=1 Tax=Chryseobacterium sp. TaxID=1871047 RepID=UPI0025BFF820|nr:hypothetical protein [Chryseobacterium sp.]
MKNSACKTENGYEIIGFGGKPVNVTDRIEKEACKCITESLLWNPNPKQFNSEQLKEIKKELPLWVAKNVKGFSAEDQKLLEAQLEKMNDKELLEKLKYKFSYFGKPASEEIPVYVMKIESVWAYCPNYSDEYAVYGKKDKFGFEFYPLKDKPNYSIIENQEWAEEELGKK